MKYTIAVAFLLGMAAAEAPVWGLRSVKDHRTDANFQIEYGNFSTEQANARPPLRSHAQLSSEGFLQLSDADHSGEFFTPGEHDKIGGGGYERVIPARYATDDDDIFMRSMIKTYALEGKNKDGSPNGAFFMDEAGARAAATEVLGTHKHLAGDELTTYLNTYWARTWNHFDVNRTGKIEVIKMPQLCRFLASDQQMYLW